MKNYLSYTFFLLLLVLVVLGGMHYLPPLEWGGTSMRRVDLLADVRMFPPVAEDEKVEDVDSLVLPEVLPAFVDTCKSGLTCIEDYADSTNRGMDLFYAALDERIRLKRPVRIAVFGDSFIEADIFTGDLRSLLQSTYGGCGVGFVPVTSLTNGFRPTVRHSFDGWDSHLITDTVYFDKSKQGISGGYYVPRQEAYVELSGQKKYALHLDTCRRSSVYFLTDGVLDLTSSVNGKKLESYHFEGAKTVQIACVEGEIGRVRWTVDRADSVLFYGVTMDGDEGVSVDNFSLRGSSGLSLRTIPLKFLRQFNELRPYDLLILQYGLNVATEKGKTYDAYKQGMLSTIEHLKDAFPNAGILIMGVGDRDYRTETGELRTMPGVKNLIRYQQAIAAESHVAFWNLFEAMGGEGSMATLVHAKPAMANYDYTHINFKGGAHLAGLLFDTMLYGKEQYDRKNQ